MGFTHDAFDPDVLLEEFKAQANEVYFSFTSWFFTCHILHHHQFLETDNNVVVCELLS